MSEDSCLFKSEFDVSRETVERLRTYEKLLRKWNPRINLVANSTLDTLWSRHFTDSAQLLTLAPRFNRWVDLGSGGGFPALVLATMTKADPTCCFTLIESDQRKATFLRTVIRELELNAEVLAKRIEDVDPLHADVLSARALAPLTTLLEFSFRHRKPDGICLFPKGVNVDAEIAEALECWQFDCEKNPSITDAESMILSIGEMQRV